MVVTVSPSVRVMIAAGCFGIFSYVVGTPASNYPLNYGRHRELAVLARGDRRGIPVVQCAKASIFMGDRLPRAWRSSAVAVATLKRSCWRPSAGCSCLKRYVIVQVISFKLTGKRVQNGVDPSPSNSRLDRAADRDPV